MWLVVEHDELRRNPAVELSILLMLPLITCDILLPPSFSHN